MSDTPTKFFFALYSERKDMYYFETPTGKSRWYAKHGACKTDAYLQEVECKRRGFIQSSELTDANARIAELERELDESISATASVEKERADNEYKLSQMFVKLREAKAELARLKAENQIMGDTLMDIDQPAGLRGYPPGTMARRALLKIKRLRGEVEIPGQIDFLRPAPPAVDGEVA